MRKDTAYYRAMMVLNTINLIPVSSAANCHATIAHNAATEVLDGLPEVGNKCHPSIPVLVKKAERWAAKATNKHKYG
jgi:hypothetical protein